MALGNTPNRLTNIFLEANKSFALNIRFKYHNGELYDLTGHVVRLAADAPKYLGGTQVLTLEAVHVDSVGGHVQFKFQAADLSLEPGEYAYDITLLAPDDFSTPVLKGDIVIGLNAEEINDNVFADNVHTSEEVEVLFGTSCDVEVRFDAIELLQGPKGETGATGDPTGVFIQPEDPIPGSIPPFFPLWVDTDAEYTYAGYVYEAPEPDPDMPTGVLYFDNDETVIPPEGLGVLYVKDQNGDLIPVTRGGPEGPEGPEGPPGVGVIVQPDEPFVTGLPEGAMWVDEDSSVPPFEGGGGAEGDFVSKTGDSMSGPLEFPGDGTNLSIGIVGFGGVMPGVKSDGPMTIESPDIALLTSGQGIGFYNEDASDFIPIQIGHPSSSGNHAATKDYVDNLVAGIGGGGAGYLPLTGATVPDFYLNSESYLALEATGVVDVNAHDILMLANTNVGLTSNGTMTIKADTALTVRSTTSDLNLYSPLPIRVGLPTGEMQQLTNLAWPTGSSDAATKAYVDAAGGGSGSSWEVVADPVTFPGVDPTGATSSTTGLTAFIAAIPQGGTGVIPAGTYLLNTRITLTNRSVHIKAEGANFVIGSTQGGVKVDGSLGTVYNVTTVQETTSGAYGHSGEIVGVTNLTLSTTAPAWKRGDLVKVVADDIPVDPDLSGLRSGQSMTVLEVVGNVVTLAGQLRDPFTTTVRVAKWNDYPFSWTGGTFSVTDALLAGTGVVAYAMQTYAMVEPAISKVNVTSSASQAFQLLYCYAPRLSDINIDYAQDYGGKYGYGVNDASEYTRVSRMKCRNVRHGYTTGAAGTTTNNNPDITKHGRTYGGIIDNSIVVGSTQTGFDTHGDSDSISFLNCASIDCYTGFGLRGTNHRVLGCLVRGYTVGTGITVSIASSSEFSYGSFIGGGTVIDGCQSYAIGVYGDTALAVETRPTYIDGVTVINRNTSVAVVRVNHSTAWLGTINVPDGGSRMSVVNAGVTLPMPKMTNVEFGALTVSPVTYRNNAESGQVDGTVVTNANSGGAAGDAFPTTSINGSPVFSTLRSYGNGTTSYRFATTDGTQMNIGYNPQDSEKLEASWNFYMEAFPTVAVALIAQIRSSSATSVSNIRIGTDGKVSVMKGLGTVLGTYATALTIGTWYRMEWMVARGTTIYNGRNVFAVYLADSAIPLWTYYADAQDMGTLNLQHCKVGKPQAGGTINLHIDNFMLKSTPPGL